MPGRIVSVTDFVEAKLYQKLGCYTLFLRTPKQKNMEIKSLCLGILATFIISTSFGQTNSLIVPPNIILPKDTLVKKQLLTSINDFLSQTEKPNKENRFVQNSDLLATSALLDEMKDLRKSDKFKEDNFYKPYLANAAQLNDSNFIIQLSYIGINENLPFLRASFTLLAEKKGGQFYFKSPLKQNTASWKIQKFGNTNVYYKNTLNTSKANVFFKMVADYDKRLNAPNRPTDFYCADNFHEVLQLLGIDYKSNYNGYAHNSETAKENNYYLDVDGTLTSGFAEFDPHDLWHERLHKVVSTDIINRPVDEGTAYLYGGSWGISWKDILEKFKAYATANPDADWLLLYNESKNFDEKGKFPLNVDFVINALIAQKIEKEKGFPSVIELLSCGKKEKGNENYFKALEKIAGISKSNFNASVWALIKAN